MGLAINTAAINFQLALVMYLCDYAEPSAVCNVEG